MVLSENSGVFPEINSSTVLTVFRNEDGSTYVDAYAFTNTGQVAQTLRPEDELVVLYAAVDILKTHKNAGDWAPLLEQYVSTIEHPVVDKESE